jgi:predicted RND superfamily exporter protein
MRERFFDWLATGSARHPWRYLIVALLTFLIGAGLAATIVPKMSWMDLLPQDEAKVQEFAEVLDEYGNSEIILVSLEGPDPDELLTFAGKLERRLLEMTTADGKPLIERVTYGEQLDFMLAHGLMLVEADDLDKMLENGQFDEPGLAAVVDGYNRMFQQEYVDEGEKDESPEAQEAAATRAIDSMWALPQALRWYLDNPDADPAAARTEIEEAVQRFTIGEEHYFSDDRSMLLVMVQPVYSSEEWQYSVPAVQRARDIFEELLLEHPAIGEHYAGPWEVTGIWNAMLPSLGGDQARIDAMRLQLPYKEPSIAPLDKLDSGTGMAGMQVVVDDEYATMFHDFGWNMLLSFVAVLALFVVTFRMWTSPVVAMVVLAMSITVALGVNALVLGELTMMAMMFPIILLGMGVDYFIHILGEFTQRRGAGESIEDALRATLQKTGKGVVTGGLTTAMAFLALGLTSFKGFTDFGISAGIGVLCTLLTSLMVLPAALVLLHRRRERRAAKKGQPVSVERSVIQFRFLAVTGSWAHRFWPVTLAVVGAGTIFLAFEAKDVAWTKDMFDVEAENLASIELSEVLEERFYLHPDSLVVSADGLEEAYALTNGLDDLGTIRMVDSISYLLPPADEQTERAERVERIRERVESWGEPPPFTVDPELLVEGESVDPRASVDAFMKALYQMDCNVITVRKSAYMAGQDRLYKAAGRIVEEGETCVKREEGKPRPPGGWPRVAASEDVKAIAAFAEANPDAMAARLDAFQDLFQPAMERAYQGMANPEPITLDSLPQTVRDRYLSDDGTKFLITAYPSGDVWNQDFQQRLFAEVESVSPRVTGTPPLFVATIERGAKEGKAATVYALVAITLLLLVDFWGFRRGKLGEGVRSTVLALIPLSVGAIWTVGAMTLLDIELNMANVIAIPLILGIGIDNGVHVIHRYRIEGPGEIGTVLATVGRAILLTSITTIAAFGTFAFGLYRGLSSMGIILGLGIAICFLMSAYLLPALFGALEKAGVEV